MKFQTQWNRHHVRGEESAKPSETVPDQSMPIIEIMRRYASGLPLGGMRQPIYQGEDSGIPPNWDQMDISEKMDFKEEHAKKIHELREDLRAQALKTGKYKQFKPSKENQQPAPSAGQKDSTDPKKDQSNIS